MRIAECLVGDETGVIVFTARNDQVDLMKAGSAVILRNAKIDMFRGSMRLAVDKWGRVEVTEDADFKVKEENNLSLVEYELVNVVEE
jgi:replication factor A1